MNLKQPYSGKKAEHLPTARVFSGTFCATRQRPSQCVLSVQILLASVAATSHTNGPPPSPCCEQFPFRTRHSSSVAGMPGFAAAGMCSSSAERGRDDVHAHARRIAGILAMI